MTTEFTDPMIEQEISDGRPWQNFASLCLGESALFDNPGKDDDGRLIELRPTRIYRERRAVAICLSGCPVLEHCLENAMQTGETDSVQGGMFTEELKERRKLWLRFHPEFDVI